MKKVALISLLSLVFASFVYGYGHGGGHHGSRGGHYHGNDYCTYNHY